MNRLTKWEGKTEDGKPRAVLVKRDGAFITIFLEAVAKLAEYEDNEADMVDFICDKIAEYFDSPCNYEFGSLDVAEYMVDKLPEWCDNTCDSKCESKKYGECWKRFFELLKEESEKWKD